MDQQQELPKLEPGQHRELLDYSTMTVEFEELKPLALQPEMQRRTFAEILRLAARVMVTMASAEDQQRAKFLRDRGLAG